MGIEIPNSAEKSPENPKIADLQTLSEFDKTAENFAQKNPEKNKKRSKNPGDRVLPNEDSPPYWHEPYRRMPNAKPAKMPPLRTAKNEKPKNSA